MLYDVLKFDVSSIDGVVKTSDIRRCCNSHLVLLEITGVEFLNCEVGFFLLNLYSHERFFAALLMPQCKEFSKKKKTSRIGAELESDPTC